MTKPAELRAMSNEQLELTLRDTIKNLFHLKVQCKLYLNKLYKQLQIY